jgi:hypothetical protein
MAVARAAHDFFGSISAAGHHEERSSHKGPERQLCDSFFPGGNGLCGVLGRKKQRTQFFTFRPPSGTRSRAAVKRVRSSKNTRVVSACKINLHSTQIIFTLTVIFV